MERIEGEMVWNLKYAKKDEKWKNQWKEREWVLYNVYAVDVLKKKAHLILSSRAATRNARMENKKTVPAASM